MPVIPGVHEGSLHTPEIAGFGAGASGSADTGAADATSAAARLHRVAIVDRTVAILTYLDRRITPHKRIIRYCSGDADG